MVLTAVDCLIRRGWSISEENIRDGLRDVVWPGRFELLRRNPDVIVDGGHNPQCLEAWPKMSGIPGRAEHHSALTGVMADKDYTHMYETMAPLVTRFVAVTPAQPPCHAGGGVEEDFNFLRKASHSLRLVSQGVEEALRQAGPQGLVLAFGSLYMVGDA